MLLTAERLHDADAAHGLVHRRCHLSAFVELSPRECGELRADRAQQLHHDRYWKQDDQRERRAEDEEIHTDAEDGGAECERLRQQVHDRLHDLQVRQRPGDELSTGDGVELADASGLDRVVEVGAQVVLELVRDAGECLRQSEHEEAGEDREPDDAPQVVGEGDGLVDDALVDHRFRQPDHGDERDATDRQHDQQDQQEPLLTREVTPRERAANDVPAVAGAAHRMPPPSCHGSLPGSSARSVRAIMAQVSTD